MRDFLAVLWVLFQPSNLIVYSILAGAWALRRNNRRSGYALVGFGSTLLAAIVFLPVSGWLMHPLEERFSVPALPSHIDGIIVLGGAVNPLITSSRGQPTLTDGAERMTETLALAIRYPRAQILFTGGPWNSNPVHNESWVARQFFKQQGLDPARVTYEDKARTTRENATNTFAVLKPSADQTWVIVTSAYHMPRAIGAFRKVGWSTMLPYPVDYRTHGAEGATLRPNVGRNLHEVDFAAKAWASLIGYYLMGYSDDLFPGP